MARPRKNDTAENMTATEIVEVEAVANSESEMTDTTQPETATEAVGETEPKKEEPQVDVKALMERLAFVEAELRKKNEASQDGTVTMVYIDRVSPDNEIELGEFGYLRGSYGTFDVPRKDFGGKFMTSLVRWLLKTRRLIVTSGLTEDEKRRFGVDYKDDEVITTEIFDRLLDMDLENLKEMFRALCPQHKWIVASRFQTAYNNGDNRVGRTKVEALNEISKMDDADGMFRPILEDMNKKI